MRILKPLPHRIAYPNRRLQRRNVTLVAGFRCSNGIVICADTQHTGTFIKFKAPKVWTDKKRAIIAGACNDDNYLQMTVDELVDNLEGLSEWTHKTVKQAVSSALTKVHKAIRLAFPPTDANRPLVYLMIGARLDDWKATLIKTAETAIAPVDEFEFIGAGDEVARLLISPFYDSNLRVTEMQRIGAYCFRYAKVSGSWCGGDTHIGTIWDGDPDVGYAHPARIHTDKEIVTGDMLNELAPALSAAWNINVSRDEFEKRVDNLVNWLRLLREQQEKGDKADVFTSSPSKPSQ